MNFLSVDDYIDEILSRVPNERLGRRGFSDVKIQRTTSVSIYHPYHKTLMDKLYARNKSFALYLYGHEDFVSEIDKEKPVDVLKMETEVIPPDFFAPLDYWKNYLKKLQKEKQLRRVEYRIDELIPQIRLRREEL